MSKTVGLGASNKKANPFPSEEIDKSLQTELEKVQKKKKKVPEGNGVLKKGQHVQKKDVSQMRVQPENRQ